MIESLDSAMLIRRLHPVNCCCYLWLLLLLQLFLNVTLISSDDLIYSGSGCFDDEEKCTGFVEMGSGDDLITPVYIPPKSGLTTSPSSSSIPLSTSKPSNQLTTPVSEEVDEEDEECVDEEEDCVDGSGSGEPSSSSSSSSSLPSVSSSERTVVITLSSPSPLFPSSSSSSSPPFYPLSSTTVSTTTIWTPWTGPNYIRPSPSPEEPIIDYEEPVPRTPRPMPPPLAIPPRPYPTTKLRLPTRPTGTPPIINVPLPVIPTSPAEEKGKTKPTLITHKSSADTTAMIIGLIAIVLIVIVIVTPLFLFLKVRYRSGPAYKTESTSKNFRFLPVATGAPTLLTSASQSTHLAGPLLEGSTVVHKGTKVTTNGKKKDGMEWYV
ncbi:uncharacterized protein LOC128394602 [Panonychus citri]|uniref:uncharacterized protein LOC128394602 n=1 Tax=Panonychus citri TaxID=50023 RepID=UPI00230794E1|nr:uncharacterized protein LOC128394602 [Panonychus citri]XP_053210919.1 uncharacterized protein LOC128394602 [Panonychus citri]